MEQRLVSDLANTISQNKTSEQQLTSGQQAFIGCIYILCANNNFITSKMNLKTKKFVFIVNKDKVAILIF
jgi:hypothetical protein